MEQPKSILSKTSISTETKTASAIQPKKINNDTAKPEIVKEKDPIDEKELYKRFLLTPTELENKVNEYFESGGSVREVIVGNGANKRVLSLNIYTLTGMCLYCGFVDKMQLFMLERNNAYAHTIKRARSKIEKIYEENLQTTGNSANIFALKNFGWVDKQEIVTEDKTIKLDV